MERTQSVGDSIPTQSVGTSERVLLSRCQKRVARRRRGGRRRQACCKWLATRSHAPRGNAVFDALRRPVEVRFTPMGAAKIASATTPSPAFEAASTRSHAPRGNAVFDALRRPLAMRFTTHGTQPRSLPRKRAPPLPDVHGRRLTARVHSARDRQARARFLAVSRGSRSVDASRICHPREPRPFHRVGRESREGSRRFQVSDRATDLRPLQQTPPTVQRGHVSDPTHCKYSSARNYAVIDSLGQINAPEEIIFSERARRSI